MIEGGCGGRWWSAVAGAGAGLAAGLVAVGAAAASDPAPVARGAEIAAVACAPCHATGASGASPKAEAPPFRELGRKYPIDSLQEALAEGVVVGHPGMPEIKMNEADIAAFLAWLKTIQSR